MLTTLRRALGNARATPLVTSAIAVMATTGITSLFGYAFWTLGARNYRPAELGQASALLAAAGTVSLLGAQWLMPALLSRLPRVKSAPERAAVLIAALAVGVGITMALAIAALGLLPLLSSPFHVLRDPLTATMFMLACITQTAGSLLDAAAIAARRGRVMTTRNALFALGKLLALGVAILAGASGAISILATWSVLALFTVLVACRRLLAVKGASWSRSGMSTWTAVQAEFVQLRRGAHHHQLSALGGALPPQILPALVAARLGSTQAGFFGLTWLLGGLCFTVSPAVAQALLAEGSYEPSQLGRRLRTAAKLIAGLLTAPVIAFAVAGGWLLTLFGPQYATHGRSLVLLIAVSALPDAITNLAVSALRVRRSLGLTAVLNGGMAVVAIALSWVLMPPLGIAGVGVAWLAAQSLGTVGVAAVWGARRYRERRGVAALVPSSADPVALAA